MVTGLGEGERAEILRRGLVECECEGENSIVVLVLLYTCVRGRGYFTVFAMQKVI